MDMATYYQAAPCQQPTASCPSRGDRYKNARQPGSAAKPSQPEQQMTEEEAAAAEREAALQEIAEANRQEAAAALSAQKEERNPYAFGVNTNQKPQQKTSTKEMYKASTDLAALAGCEAIHKVKSLMVRVKGKATAYKMSNMDSNKLKISLARIEKVLGKCSTKIARLNQEAKVEQKQRIAEARLREEEARQIKKQLRRMKIARRQEELMDVLHAANEEKDDGKFQDSFGSDSTGVTLAEGNPAIDVKISDDMIMAGGAMNAIENTAALAEAGVAVSSAATAATGGIPSGVVVNACL